MFRLIFLLFIFAIGFSFGITYDRKQMRAECKSGEGQWTGTICVNSELLQ
ncbi:hypothetical protein SAMN04488523_110131 [Sulfitobacter brevis]|uniref:Uncharacterized protein n=1 Tax=Sulfitobacter brevis TaxID=74348 RepID=A0A1I2DE60_9RHOB|nr:hypothetical protein [Sulfitobacter brevis]SFE78728.1 hypothetical protein SAMN04488523_110131 [Sulfitobacter brevis]